MQGEFFVAYKNLTQSALLFAYKNVTQSVMIFLYKNAPPLSQFQKFQEKSRNVTCPDFCI